MENKHTRSVSLIDGHIEETDVIKALECCQTDDCKSCPLSDYDGCKSLLFDGDIVLNLINRQQAEIVRLQKLLSGAKDCIDEIEYAMNKVGTSNDRIDEALEAWNNLVKEMTEVSENGK